MENAIVASRSEKIYKQRVNYFERPISSNHGYDYKLMCAVNPYDFTVTINDAINGKYEARLKEGLSELEKVLKDAKKDDDNIRIESQLVYDGMPVLMMEQQPSGARCLSRGEVISFEGQELTILRVDKGGVVKKQREEVYPITLSLLRIPKLGIRSRLALIRPENGFWPTDRDYAKDFVGKESNTITFLDYFPSSNAYEAILDVDRINVSLSYIHKVLAQPIQPVYHDKASSHIKTYPVADYSYWIGLKVPVFGIKVFKDQTDQGKMKCVLQMEPETVNAIQEEILAYISSEPDTVKKVAFEKKVGTPCLAPYQGEYFRAVILEKQQDKFLVEFVDYKDQYSVAAADLLQLPAKFLRQAEGAVVCLMTDLLSGEIGDIERLSPLINEQDLYAVIDACDPEIFGPELLVSLFQPTEEFSGADKSFADLLDIKQRPAVVNEILQMMQPVEDKLANIFLVNKLPDPNKLYPGAMISVINNWDSIWIQFEESIENSSTLCAEMAQFYDNGGCLVEKLEEFLSNDATGKYVVAKQPDEEDDLWCRCKVMEEKDQQLTLLFIDYGNVETLNKVDVMPMHTYFAKDALLAFQVAVKL